MTNLVDLIGGQIHITLFILDSFHQNKPINYINFPLFTHHLHSDDVPVVVVRGRVDGVVDGIKGSPKGIFIKFQR